MPNERKTERLVRERLDKAGYFTDPTLAVEEQCSDSPKINKILRAASKRGLAGGRPEFIISSSQHADFIVVVECKADVAHHESEAHDKYADYAVDGALLYASFLAKEYDVLAIAVSGQTKKELKISHYLNLKGVKSAQPIFGQKLLPFNDYHTGYITDPRKFNQDYEKLLGYSKQLNGLLHAKKIKESQRSLLISGILIGLQNAAFEASFKKYKTAQLLANHLVATIIDELTGSDLPPSKIDTLRHAFSFIKTHATLSKDKSFFQDLISGIDEHLNSFRKTHRYFDTLGQFYIEFLRYANNDKGLGIVLTPPHVTELFCSLANVNKDSVILDNACGTGGFLISAMKTMVADAKGDSDKVKNIQKHQLVGIEYQDDIYTLAVTNMVLHDDGKSNIYQGDCFALADTIRKKYGLNVGLLNPPYKTKKSDIEELEFVLNNIEMLESGVCVAIVPMSSVLTQEGAGVELKRRLLEKHTLEAVLSMPAELFHNSKVGVVTSSLVITAHIPHPSGKKTWFGYCKDDGFVKTKHRGRIDLANKWVSIRDRWVDAYRNREVLPGFSVMKSVSAKDEWCAEAYIETDYSKLTQAEFERAVRSYALFRLANTQGNAAPEADDANSK